MCLFLICFWLNVIIVKGRFESDREGVRGVVVYKEFWVILIKFTFLFYSLEMFYSRK